MPNLVDWVFSDNTKNWGIKENGCNFSHVHGICSLCFTFLWSNAETANVMDWENVHRFFTFLWSNAMEISILAKNDFITDLLFLPLDICQSYPPHVFSHCKTNISTMVPYGLVTVTLVPYPKYITTGTVTKLLYQSNFPNPARPPPSPCLFQIYTSVSRNMVRRRIMEFHSN